jgi:protein-S-isoprenylcysteine O-methyltransferase Ste14
MALGTAASTGAWALLAAMSIVFGVLYHFIILDEETKLQRIFGAPYTLYCANVARFFPKPWPAPRAVLEEINPEPSHHRFSMELARKNKAMEAYLTFLALMGFVALVAWAWQSFV